MHALQRVQASRSIGFSCRHSTSKAPSQPDRPVTLPDHTGNLLSSGSSPPPLVASTETSSWLESRSAQSSAAAAGPMIRTWPCDLNSTAGAGSGSGSAAIAISAAILGVDFSADQPPSSRMFTNLMFLGDSSLNSAASWVQATIRSSLAPAAAWNAPMSLRHSSWCTASGSPALSPAASAFASSGMVRLQLQTLSVLLSRLIALGLPGCGRFGCGRFGGGHFGCGRCFGCGRLRGSLLFRQLLLLFVAEEQRARLVHGLQHLLRDRLADRPVAGKGLERIGQVEVRVAAEQLLQRHAPQRVLHLGMHEAGKVGFGLELLHRREARLGRFSRSLDRSLLLEPRPALEKVLFLRCHRYTRSLGCTNERGLMRFSGSGR